MKRMRLGEVDVDTQRIFDQEERLEVLVSRVGRFELCNKIQIARLGHLVSEDGAK